MHYKSNNFSIDLDGFQLLILIGIFLIVILLIIAMIVRRKNAKMSVQGSNDNLKLNKEQVAKLDLLAEQNKQIREELARLSQKLDDVSGEKTEDKKTING